jgi:hypothetical protein
MGTYRLAVELGVDVKAAAQLADDFRRAHPGLDLWLKVTQSDSQRLTARVTCGTAGAAAAAVA